MFLIPHRWCFIKHTNIYCFLKYCDLNVHYFMHMECLIEKYNKNEDYALTVQGPIS